MTSARGSRVHLMEILRTGGAVLLPLVVLGCSAPALNAGVIRVGIQAVLAQAALRFGFGGPECVIVTPRCHTGITHVAAEYVDVNHAIHPPLLDMLMGTFKRRPANEWPHQSWRDAARERGAGFGGRSGVRSAEYRNQAGRDQ